MSEEKKVSRRNWMKYAGAGAVVVAAAGAGYYATQPRAGAPKGEPIKIGVMAPLTGGFSGPGRTIRDGTLLAIKEINAAGGVLDRPLEPHVRDDEFNPGIAVRKGTELIDSVGVKAIFGSIGGAIIPPMNDLTKQKNMTYLVSCLSMKASQLKGVRNPWQITALPSLTANGRVAAEYLAVRKKYKRIYIFYPDYAGGLEYVDPLREALQKKYGCEIVGWDPYPLNNVEFSPLITRAMAVKPPPDVVVAGGSLGADLMNLIKQSRAAGLMDKIPMYSGNNTLVDSMAIGAEAMGGVESFLAFYWERNTPEVKAFTEAYMREYGEVPDSYCVGIYALAWHWAETANKVGSIEPEKVIPEMYKKEFFRGRGRQRIRALDGQVVADSLFIRVRKPDNPELKENRYKLFDVLEVIEGKEEHLMTPKELGYD